MPEHVGRMTDADLAELAEAAADRAIGKVFKRLRIKIDDDDALDAFVDNQRFLTELRAGKTRFVAEVKNTGFDLLKQTARYLFLVGLVALGAAAGIHFQAPGLTPAIMGKP